MMSSGMTVGKFGAYLAAVLLMVIGGVGVGYDEKLIGWILIIGGGGVGNLDRRGCDLGPAQR